MLSKHQIEYIASVPKDKITHIYPFDIATTKIAEELRAQINNTFPNAEVFHIGSSKLGIAGENDIDMIVVIGREFDSAFKKFEEWYGKPAKTALHDNYAKWDLIQHDFPVELHLIDVKKPYFEEQLKTQKILEENMELRDEYEKMKMTCDGLLYIEYLTRKFEFWNRIIS